MEREAPCRPSPAAAWRGLQRRQVLPEWMDEPDLDARLHAQALAGLSRINLISRSSGVLWPPIRDLARESLEKEISVLDLGSGGGDVAIGLCRRAAQAGIKLRALGCDLSPQAVELAAANAASAGVAARFQTLDVFRDALPTGFDVVLCSLFMHHQEGERAVELLRLMAAAAGRLVLVNDLVRSKLSYALVTAAVRTVTRSPVVHVDGPLSVAAAFSLEEARSLAECAGLHGAHVESRFPCRFLLSWRKTA